VDLFTYPYLFSFECFLSLGAATYKECQNLWVLGSTSELVNLTILAKTISHLKFSEAKSQRREKNTLGELWIMHNFSLHNKSNYLVLRCTGKLNRYQT
jgi:hypothetical protein